MFIYTPEQDELRSDFTGWLAEWNKSDGGKHGQLEVTADASQADIILARFVSALNLKLGESKEAISIDYDRATNAVTHGTVARAKASTPLSYYANVYCYVLEKDEGRLNILWHGTDAVKIYHDVKARGGNYKNLKGTKDSGSAGDRLRNKFFEMIKASSRT
ncbi:MAG: hypothetical protein M3348_03220 [Acidobacteriota bacterium]|nr:hypothetical protein [Acidobacteriota bacterium]